MIIDIAEEEGCSSNLHTEVLRYDSNVNIYHKLPKPREIIKPQLLGSQEIRRIPGFEFKEKPCLKGQPPLPQTLNSNPVKGAPRPTDDQLTLFQYYSQRRDLLVYDRNAYEGETQETFNLVTYRPERQASSMFSPTKIYAQNRAAIRSFNSSFALNPELPPEAVTERARIQPICSATLQFESNFESGNLGKVYKIGEYEFDLLLSSDINTSSYTQWFYFKVSDAGSGQAATFNIVNLMKSSSLYSKGMKVLVHSSLQNIWVRGGNNILYRKNNLLLSVNSLRTYSTLTFSYTFQPGESVYFAYTHPYTYSQLCQDLDQLEAAHLHSRIFFREVLCETPCGNRCQILTISKKPFRGKPTIFLSARVHPGETISSFVLRGMIDFLLSNHAEAQQLRTMFVWKIVPMLNPDGVIHGNYRCNLAGHDLNRRWQNPDPSVHPEIYYYKRYILKCKGENNNSDYIQQQCNRNIFNSYLSAGGNSSCVSSTDPPNSNIAMFIDLHGHSSKKNIFIYGCSDESAKEFPLLASKIVRGFSFKDCAFEIESKKEGTARVALWRDLQIPNIFTVESSFCSFEEENFHFKIKDYEEVGKGLCQTILLYHSKEENDVVTRQNLLRQLNSIGLTKELIATGNPNDSADSEEDTSIRKKVEKQVSPVKKVTNFSLMKVTVNRVPIRPQSPPLFMERPQRRMNTDIRQGHLQVPKVIDIFMAPLKPPRSGVRTHLREERLVRQKFAIVSHGALSPIKNTPPRRMFHYGANFHFPQLKP